MFCLTAKRDWGKSAAGRIATIVAVGNISNFERSEKYIDCSLSEQISSCEATYRHTEGIDIELAISEHIDKKKGLLPNDRQ